ncbi:MAG: preprotein translocase subunit SecG [Clostridia bacterium]|nr:preprotein translocase subunit SecG [Clostridia bacterium]
MDTVVLIFQIALLALGVFLVAAVLMQQGKAHGLSGAIAGGAETFFGKEKAKSMNKKLSIATTIFGIVFVLAVLVLYILQPDAKFSTTYSNNNWVYSPYQQLEVSELQKVEDTTNKTDK